MHSLVIVESPAKAKTIEKYLGKDYEVKASMGHLRDLPKSKLGVDVERDFEPVYEPIKGKEDIISGLKRAAKKADTVYLATDPDREGEAISWHLKQLLDLPDRKARRVTFNEITKNVVRQGIDSPREIDQDLVDAQQARRILDRLVGYKLSPLLWKKVRRGLSAGRVQSVATRMVDDRDREIEAFVPEEYWTLDARMGDTPRNLDLDSLLVPEPPAGANAENAAPGETGDGANPAQAADAASVDPSGFTARFHGTDGKKRELKDRDEVNEVIRDIWEASQQGPFNVSKVKRADKRRSPAPPFTTSTLQQDASRKLNMTPRRTMAVAQQLYEGVEISGEGAVGLITYMRTDSLRLSEEAIAAARNFIADRYGPGYCPEKPHRYRAKSNAQDAHEAIRPSDVRRTPEDVKKDLTREQYNLYRLIWSRFVACQMSSAVYDTVAAELQAGRHNFRASASTMKFPGYTAVYEEGKDEEKDETYLSRQSLIWRLQAGDTVAPQAVYLQGLDPRQHFTQPPAHYTDATLIRAMEEQGIGRPSTYAPTVSTILDRNYVMKVGKYLHITNLGRVVTELMKERFSDIADLNFTARMEGALDEVEEGKRPWKEVLRGFYGKFDQSLEAAEKDLDGVRIKVPDEVSEEICPVCGRNLVIKTGRFGRFLACPGFPECTFTMPLVEVMPGRCPKCGGRLMKRTGVSQTSKRQYTYYCCEHQVATKHTPATCDFRTWDVPLADNCPVCGQSLFKRQGRGRMKPYCINPACPNFLPEDQRGYPRRPARAADTAEESGSTDEAADDETPKKTARKSAAKSTTAKKTTAKTATKKAASGTTKTTTKKTASTTAKTTTKKTASGTAAAKKSTARKKKEDAS